MRSRPMPVTVAALLLVLLSLSDFPLPWEVLFPGVEEPPDFIVYAGIVLGIVGLVVAIGLWMMKRWSFWATIVVGVLNFLLAVPGVFEAPGTALRAAIAVSAAIAVVIIVLVVLPASRRAFTA
jgi:hypothetical protein